MTLLVFWTVFLVVGVPSITWAAARRFGHRASQAYRDILNTEGWQPVRHRWLMRFSIAGHWRVECGEQVWHMVAYRNLLGKMVAFWPPRIILYVEATTGSVVLTPPQTGIRWQVSGRLLSGYSHRLHRSMGGRLGTVPLSGLPWLALSDEREPSDRFPDAAQAMSAVITRGHPSLWAVNDQISLCWTVSRRDDLCGQLRRGRELISALIEWLAEATDAGIQSEV